MAQTPEGKIKDDVKDLLKEQHVFYHMPVSFGYGAATLDFFPCIVVTKFNNPLPFFIETKKKGDKPRPRQNNLKQELEEEYRCKVWVINSQIDIERLRLWLQTVRGM